MSEIKNINTELLVVGGGIGGLAVAYALSKIGINVTVIEQASKFSEIGAGIQLGPNSYKMFERLGILNDVTKLAAFPDFLEMKDSVTAESLVKMPVLEDFKKLFGYKYAVIYRADLHKILYEKCQKSEYVNLFVDTKAHSIKQNDNEVIVSCENGYEFKSQALVAADGLWSKVREMLVSDGAPRPAGHVAYRAVLNENEFPQELKTNSMTIWAGEKTHLVHYPLRNGKLFNLVAVFHSNKFSEGWNDYGDPNELKESFKDKCPQVKMLLDKIEDWRMWVLNDREPIDNWVTGRIALLGDAAHPMLQYLAQGANMAIEDSVCLADMIVNENKNFSSAFQRYCQARFLRTTRVQVTARLYGEIYHASGATRKMRNAEISSWSVEKHFQGMSWLYGVSPTWRDDGIVNELGEN